MLFRTFQPVKHDCVHYDVDETIELAFAVAEILMALGIVGFINQAGSLNLSVEIVNAPNPTLNNPKQRKPKK